LQRTQCPRLQREGPSALLRRQVSTLPITLHSHRHTRVKEKHSVAASSSASSQIPASLGHPAPTRQATAVAAQKTFVDAARIRRAKTSPGGPGRLSAEKTPFRRHHRTQGSFTQRNDRPAQCCDSHRSHRPAEGRSHTHCQNGPTSNRRHPTQRRPPGQSTHAPAVKAGVMIFLLQRNKTSGVRADQGEASLQQQRGLDHHQTRVQHSQWEPPSPLGRNCTLHPAHTQCLHRTPHHLLRRGLGVQGTQTSHRGLRAPAHAGAVM
jgi:hypothetical protein